MYSGPYVHGTYSGFQMEAFCIQDPNQLQPGNEWPACPERKQTAPTNAAQAPVIAAGAGPPLLLLAGGQGGAKDKAGILRFELPETKSYGA
jgi:hypothetical protein